MSTMVVVGARAAAGLMVDTVVGSAVGVGALIVFAVTGVDVVEI